MFNPVSTYRIQFHKGFNFNDFEQIIPYLEKLGVSTVYASPIFKSTPGSMHGYDTVNPLEINPEIGTLEQLRQISKQLKAKNISWLQDIVPNHMAYHQDNEWLMDVLEKGPLSAYKEFFDQSMSSDLYKGPIMVPFLGSDLNEIVQNNEIRISWNNNRLCLNYAEQNWPLNLDAYATVFKSAANPTKALAQLIEQIDLLKQLTDAAEYSTAMDEIKLQIGGLFKNEISKKEIEECLSSINNDKGSLLQIAEQQYYRLCNWKETNSNINFRRFFTVNSLICLDMQLDEVFEKFHTLIKSLLQEGVFQGLRIDHIDGLYDPSGYLEKLRRLAGDDTYIVVEKILGTHEFLPQWPIQGTTGYDFLVQLNNLLTNTQTEATFTKYYQELTGTNTSVQDQIAEKKNFILTNQMGGELNNLADLAAGINKTEVNKDELKQAIGEFLVRCPVYRFYGNSFPLQKDEAHEIKQILSNIKTSDKKLSSAVDLLEDIFTGKTHHHKKALNFYMRCMQFSGPLMAKGVEDTLMYTYERFIAHNEVGDAPAAFGITVNDFHEKMQVRQQQWPLAINGTATHDTKRGEDFRARLNVLPDIAEEWFKTVDNWRHLNLDLKQIGAPDANDEYFVYQTLIGSYPMPDNDDDNYNERLQAYLEKTMREAKLHSDWASPNEKYETAVKQFALGLLDKRRPFWKSFTELHRKVADFGIVNSLSQVLLKFTCPGVPDVYQGCEHWDFSFVDPDNRRPVDYDLRNDVIDNNIKLSLADLWKSRFDGQIKLWLVQKLFNIRKQEELLFTEGEYIPLEVTGKYARHVFAFARVYKKTWYIIAAPLGIATICELQGNQTPEPDWEDTKITLPSGAPDKFEDILRSVNGNCKQGIAVKDLFKDVPAAILKLSHPDSGRGSGILMHISSLPSSFGIGDLGPAAKKFANMLHRNSQKYWQLLPLSPVSEQNQYSPYSSYSSMAGNELLISPELLVNDALLTNEDINKYKLPSADKVDYDKATKAKEFLFEAAWLTFAADNDHFLKDQFAEFCEKEKDWLNDHALYVVLKQQNNHKPWYNWPEQLKQRDKKVLADFEVNNQDAINKQKWLQFIFARQWQQLKDHCNHLGIILIGDLPFYISYDSVDVWANPEIFSLNNKGQMEFVAGVPPDYFNASGQLWGMPVFRWDELKKQGYKWWVNRIGKNIELFDLIRLDHFRAFAAYWSVPASEDTAINGSWVKGPGNDLFNILKKKFGKLPFIAEDLGDIDDDVYQLRDDFQMPGMRVLQFAFGDQAGLSPHLPHNYTQNCIAYTGTHDNSTILGWYHTEADKHVQKNIKAYTGIKAKDKNINQVFMRMAMASVAKIVIIPMQDILGLDERARMNTPAGKKGNWLWQLLPNDIKPDIEEDLKKSTKIYNREN